MCLDRNGTYHTLHPSLKSRTSVVRPQLQSKARGSMHTSVHTGQVACAGRMGRQASVSQWTELCESLITVLVSAAEYIGMLLC